MNKEDEIYVGIDIGATNIRFLIYNVRKNKCYPYIKQRFIPYKSVLEEVEQNICYILEKTLDMNQLGHKNIKGIGIAMAPNFNRNTGIITRWPNHQLWENFNLKEYLHTRWGKDIEIIFEDDANGAVLGEYLYDEEHLAGKNCAYITVSTGVGGGLILNNELYIGEHGWAGEFGHVTFGNNQIMCSCGKKGCLQTLVSGPAILKRFQKLYGEKYDVNDLKKVSFMAVNGNRDSINVFEEAGDTLAIFCGNLIEMMDITCIILGGGVLQQGGNIMIDRIRNSIEQLYGNSHRNIIVKKSSLGDMNGVVGALTLVCNNKFLECI